MSALDAIPYSSGPDPVAHLRAAWARSAALTLPAPLEWKSDTMNREWWNTLRRRGIRRLSMIRMSIGLRIGLGFGVVLAFFTVTTILAGLQLRAVQKDMTAAIHGYKDIAARAAELRLHVDEIYLGAVLVAITTQSDDVKFYGNHIHEELNAYEGVKNALEALTQANSGLADVATALRTVSDAESSSAEIRHLVDQRVAASAQVGEADLALDSSMVDTLSTTVKGQIDYWLRSVDVVIRTAEQASLHRQQEAEANAASAYKTQIGLLLSALAVGMVSALFIARSVSRPIRIAADIADAVAKGQLSVTIPPGRRDETGFLMEALARMQSSLNAIVREVRDAAQSIAVASTQLASGNLDLSQRSESTATQLQRTAGAVASLVQAIEQSERSAAQADDLARSAASAARNGGEVIGNAIASMVGIARQAGKIEEIVDVIDNIAFQTNMLALNAAVEAARAGDQGRGFAVVAGEVRGLAQRSALAAKDVKALIESAVGGIGDGERLVHDAGRKMQDIVSQISHVTTAMTEIAGASGAQSRSVNEVDSAMNELDSLTQRNAALVEQSAAASESLKNQADRLAQVVLGFNLG